MGIFGYSDTPMASLTLGSATSKVSVAGSTAYQLVHSVTITPAADEYVEILQIQQEIAANVGASGVTLTMGYSFQDAGSSEGATEDGGTAPQSALAQNLTNDNYQSPAVSASPLHRGLVGVAVTVRSKVKTSSAANTTAMGGRNLTITGRKVRRVPAGNAFRGVF